MELSGAGLGVPERVVFLGYRCFNFARVTQCIGTLGEVANFRRQRSGNLLSVRIRAVNRWFEPSLSSAGVTLTLSMGEVGVCGQVASCRVWGARKQVATCRR